MAQEFAERLKQIEQKWQKKWEEANLHKAEKDEDKEKKYILDMFPYPSGRMHMGHGRAFSLSDVYARFKSMQGYNVMHPMGWDAFGMPAENAAIDRDINPGEWTLDCISDMKEEFKRLGFSLDWDREVTTCEPEYYKWDQWIFQKMLEEGIAYRDEAEVNWCPSCETVLADEQVEDGLCWRCDSEVNENKEMEQWKLAITDYADELVADLEQLDGWPNKVREMQENWIGRSTGARINFPLKQGRELEVFTTRPDTIFGATFMALAPEHELAEEIAEENEEVADYIEVAKQKDDEEREEKSKAGVFTGRYAENPFNDEEIPIYVAEFVLEGAGTGAIMAVPAHDQRDFEFAQEHEIDVQTVVEPAEDHSFGEDGAWEGDGDHINSDFLNDLDKEEAIKTVIERLEEKEIGEEDVNYKLRDWLISRQRYWGTPIPVVYCDECGAVPVPEEDLPVELPEDVEFTGRGNPIETSDSFMETECPECGGKAERETDTMDTFINSSWYFLRYCSPDFEDAPFEEDAADYWMNVDQYVGGIEHATMHLIYARFFQKFLRDQGMVEDDEPFEKLLTQGMVNHPAYKCPEHGWMYPEEIEDENICSKCGREVEVETIKMSKSKNNVVRPSELVDEYGADTARLFILSASHPSKELDWSKDGVQASHDMLERIERLVTENEDLLTEQEASLEDAKLEDSIVSSRIQRAKENVTEYNDNYEFNLAAGEVDKLLTKLYWYKQRDADPAIFTEGVKTLIKLVAPFAPHLGDELWNKIDEGFLYNSDWPKVDEELLDEEAEKIDEYFDRVASDIREIQEMVDSEPAKIKVIRAADWKYEAFQEIEENLDLGDVGAITGKTINAGFKQHADTVNQKVQDAFENPGKFRNQLMEQRTEIEALEANESRWKEEFDAEVIIEAEERSDEGKADRAEPGKPAIVME
ncbi:leucine--tRNA ligase [Candidatus Nanohalobium constans]|uniref:Leucine--tRNA ligase n=1 Tax=Candidatus Nanohalobium constans TaxID=2565781 RepID=A0A5Q0UEP8_9ARCH|nr:leucine--tRNA ligase [Candidatus Nanohalobium constans]QGA80016.1 leucyl-tRNA synthetase [Candidatus Nanohalobium constans]